MSILQPRKDFLIALELRVFKGPRDVLGESIDILETLSVFFHKRPLAKICFFSALTVLIYTS